MATYVISPAMRVRFERYIKPKLSKRRMALIKKLAMEVSKKLGVERDSSSG